MAALERIHAPSQAEFDAAVERRAPFVITGVVDRWRAMSWTKESLKDAVRGRMLVPEVHPEGDYFDTWNRYGFPLAREVEGARLLDLIDAPEGRERFYLSGGLAGLAPSLADDVAIPDFAIRHDGRTNRVGKTMFYGRDTASPLHFHPVTHVTLAQLVGTKTVRLYRPGITDAFYCRSVFETFNHHSKIDFNDLAKYPKFAGVAPDHEHELRPGELLYFPVQWWHVVFSHGLSVAVHLSWLADRRFWHFPSPGRRTAIAKSSLFHGAVRPASYVLTLLAHGRLVDDLSLMLRRSRRAKRAASA